eukprot:1377592-Amorphochlora_amoeboformis.AAC.2
MRPRAGQRQRFAAVDAWANGAGGKPLPGHPYTPSSRMVGGVVTGLFALFLLKYLAGSIITPARAFLETVEKYWGGYIRDVIDRESAWMSPLAGKEV